MENSPIQYSGLTVQRVENQEQTVKGSEICLPGDLNGQIHPLLQGIGVYWQNP